MFKEKEIKTMEVTFAPRGVLQIDDARIIWRNFEGRGDKYNKEGDRNFNLVIPNQEIADMLMNDKNEFGVGWNIRIKAPREDGEAPFMSLKVNLKFNDRGPVIYLNTGRVRRRIYEEEAAQLDRISISRVDLDIRPNDGEGTYGPYRSAWLNGMEIFMETNRFEERMAEEEHPEE